MTKIQAIWVPQADLQLIQELFNKNKSLRIHMVETHTQSKLSIHILIIFYLLKILHVFQNFFEME